MCNVAPLVNIERERVDDAKGCEDEQAERVPQLVAEYFVLLAHFGTSFLQSTQRKRWHVFQLTSANTREGECVVQEDVKNRQSEGSFRGRS